MSLNKRIIISTKNYLDKAQQLKEVLQEIDMILVGAGAGLSTSAGFTYTGKRFKENFSDFIEKYGFRDMYSGGFYPFGSLEEYWAYWSRYIYINRYIEKENSTYKKLFGLVKEKDYFVLTTNVDHQFQKAGFNKSRLFYTQGDYGLFQCSEPCHNATYDNKEIIYKMVEKQTDMKISTELIPYCPICGRPITMNLRTDQTFVEDNGWHMANKRYSAFLDQCQNRKVLFLELGVGRNTPGIIKYPFWQMTMENPKAIYACINYGEAVAPEEIEKQSICINGDIGEVLSFLCNYK